LQLLDLFDPIKSFGAVIGILCIFQGKVPAADEFRKLHNANNAHLCLADSSVDVI